LHTFSTPRARRRPTGALLFALVALVGAGTETRADTIDPIAHGIVLRDGAVLPTVGDHARVGDTVVFSLPLVVDEAGGWSQLVTLPSEVVDWPRTLRHAASVRAARYAETRGPADFTLLAVEVADALRAIAGTDDPAAQRRLALEARRRVLDWSAGHHVFRQEDLQEFVGVFDGVIWRLAPDQAGPIRGTVLPEPPPPPEPLVTGPVDQVRWAMTAARLTRVPAERMTLLQAAVGLLERYRDGLPGRWRRKTLETAQLELRVETQLDRAYAALTGPLLARAYLAGQQTDVAAVSAVLDELDAGDTRLGGARPRVVAAARAALVRIRRDAEARGRAPGDGGAVTAADRPIAEHLAQILRQADEHRRVLEAIRRGARDGFDAVLLERRLETLLLSLQRMRPPAGLEGVHSLLRRGIQLAAGAASLGRDGAGPTAPGGGGPAAAGALMLLGRVDDELDTLLGPVERP